MFIGVIVDCVIIKYIYLMYTSIFSETKEVLGNLRDIKCSWAGYKLFLNDKTLNNV